MEHINYDFYDELFLLFFYNLVLLIVIFTLCVFITLTFSFTSPFFIMYFGSIALLLYVLYFCGSHFDKTALM